MFPDYMAFACSLLVIDFSLLLHSSKHFCHLLLNSMQFKESFVSEMTSNKKTVSLITLEAKLIAATYIQKMNLWCRPIVFHTIDESNKCHKSNNCFHVAFSPTKKLQFCSPPPFTPLNYLFLQSQHQQSSKPFPTPSHQFSILTHPSVIASKNPLPAFFNEK